AKFDFSVNFLPYHDEIKGAPQNSIIGGASLWVLGGKKPVDYKGVAKFFSYLSQPDLQARWHEQTGYVPITNAAFAAAQKAVYFRGVWLPLALVLPQIAVTLVFFFWPAVQAVWYSFQIQDAFGLSSQFVGFANFVQLFRDAEYLRSFEITAVFSLCVAVFGLALSLLLATMADRVLRGALPYKTLLIWPYAVAPAVAGVLWAFLF